MWLSVNGRPGGAMAAFANALARSPKTTPGLQAQVTHDTRTSTTKVADYRRGFRFKGGGTSMSSCRNLTS